LNLKSIFSDKSVVLQPENTLALLKALVETSRQEFKAENKVRLFSIQILVILFDLISNFQEIVRTDTIFDDATFSILEDYIK